VPAVDEIAKLLEKNPPLKLTIEGHTDNVGDPAHNKALSQQRAGAVMGSLVAAGIAKERLSTLAWAIPSRWPITKMKADAPRTDASSWSNVAEKRLQAAQAACCKKVGS